MAAALGNAPRAAAFLYRQKKEAFWKMIALNENVILLCFFVGVNYDILEKV